MKPQYIFAAIVFLICSFAFYEPLFTRSNGAPAGNTNAPGEMTCAQSSCHNTTLNDGPGDLQVDLMLGDSVVTEYETGTQYTVRLTLTDDDMNAAGFQVTALTDDGNNMAGSFQTSSGNKVVMGSGREYLTHTSPVTSFEGNTQTWELNWTSPAQSEGDLTFYACANGANGDNNSAGDNIYDGSASVSDANATSINASFNKQQMKVYPNPVQKTIHLKLPESFDEKGNIILTNLNGRQVADFGTHHNAGQKNLKLRVSSHLRSGVYILHLTGTKTSINKKLIIE